jgi:Na+-transporting NADH:ubiquinone oxidoreductase subunit NqrB
MDVAPKPWDARLFQMAFQLVFLTYGIFFLQWKAEWLSYVLFIGTGLLMQWAADSITSKKIIHPLHWTNGGWKSALISCFSLCLLLKTNHWYICIIAASLTVLSKYIFRYKGKHIFNPSAFGIVATVLFTKDAWLSPGQWGSGAVIFFAVCCLGLIVVTRVQKLDITLAFLLTFAGLLFARQIIYLNWSFDVFIQSVSTGSLLLFSFFMISDPKTAPNHPVARIIWAVLIATVAFYLTAFKWMNSTPIYVLVFAAPLVPILNKLMHAKPFEWKTNIFHTTKQRIQSVHS